MGKKKRKERGKVQARQIALVKKKKTNKRKVPTNKQMWDMQIGKRKKEIIIENINKTREWNDKKTE